MNARRSVLRQGTALMTVAVLLTALGTDVYGWSVSGIVKNSLGAALSGVAVTVKDSSKYSALTDVNGNFSMESSGSASINQKSACNPVSYSIRMAGNDLLISSSLKGMLELALKDCSGRTIPAAKAVPAEGVSHVKLPPGLGNKVIFLRVRNAGREELYTLISAANCLHVEPSQLSIKTGGVTNAAVVSYPTLLFKKTDFRDTSFAMTSEKMTNISMVMAAGGQICALPSTTLKWQSSGILVDIKPDANHKIVSVKDPTIQKYNGKYLIYCTVYNTANSTWSMQFIQFEDFSKANDVTPIFMDQVPGFSGYKCAPELFYFEPKKLWYLTWQQQDPAYSTTTTPDNPQSWSTPKPFFSGSMPNKPNLPIDYFPIADDNNFYIFFTGDDGKVYRIKTTLANFPSGFGAPVVVTTSGADVIYEGSSHYKVKGTTNTYLHLVEGMGATERYYSAWTSEGIEGEWKEYKVGPSDPFARSNNVTYATGVTDWTDDVSHGELLRDNPNQTQELDPCKLQLLYQGKDPSSGGAYNLLPYRLGLLTLQ
jgi:hypothetical protein